MPAPPRARQPLPLGLQHRGRVAPRHTRPLLPAIPRAQRRHHRSSRGTARLWLIGGLVVATLAAGAWYVLGRGTAEPTTDYAAVEHRFKVAAGAMHFTPLVIQQFAELQEFNDAVDSHASVMEQSLAEFARMADEEAGPQAKIALDSVRTAEQALRAVSAFRDAIVTTNDLVDAQDALDEIDRAVEHLDANVRRWKQL